MEFFSSERGLFFTRILDVCRFAKWTSFGCPWKSVLEAAAKINAPPVLETKLGLLLPDITHSSVTDSAGTTHPCISRETLERRVKRDPNLKLENVRWNSGKLVGDPNNPSIVENSTHPMPVKKKKIFVNFFLFAFSHYLLSVFASLLFPLFKCSQASFLCEKMFVQIHEIPSTHRIVATEDVHRLQNFNSQSM